MLVLRASWHQQQPVFAGSRSSRCLSRSEVARSPTGAIRAGPPSIHPEVRQLHAQPGAILPAVENSRDASRCSRVRGRSGGRSTGAEVGGEKLISPWVCLRECRANSRCGSVGGGSFFVRRAGDEAAAIRAERHRKNRTRLALDGWADRCAALRVPQPHCCISGTDNLAAIGAECHRKNPTRMALEGSGLAASPYRSRPRCQPGGEPAREPPPDRRAHRTTPAHPDRWPGPAGCWRLPPHRDQAMPVLCRRWPSLQPTHPPRGQGDQGAGGGDDDCSHCSTVSRT